MNVSFPLADERGMLEREDSVTGQLPFPSFLLLIIHSSQPLSVCVPVFSLPPHFLLDWPHTHTHTHTGWFRWCIVCVQPGIFYFTPALIVFCCEVNDAGPRSRFLRRSRSFLTRFLNQIMNELGTIWIVYIINNAIEHWTSTLHLDGVWL